MKRESSTFFFHPLETDELMMINGGGLLDTIRKILDYLKNPIEPRL